MKKGRWRGTRDRFTVPFIWRGTKVDAIYVATGVPIHKSVSFSPFFSTQGSPGLGET
jgi:hypothetical protein